MQQAQMQSVKAKQAAARDLANIWRLQQERIVSNDATSPSSAGCTSLVVAEGPPSSQPMDFRGFNSAQRQAIQEECQQQCQRRRQQLEAERQLTRAQDAAGLATAAAIKRAAALAEARARMTEASVAQAWNAQLQTRQRQVQESRTAAATSPLGSAGRLLQFGTSHR